jgi:arginine/ornithine N-succinyltransferase beta subunit
VTKTRAGVVKIVDAYALAEAPGESCDGLIAAEHRAARGKTAPDSMFRCVHADFAERAEAIALSVETAAALSVTEGDMVHALALARHTRL